ncbi:fatty acyl-AMP ligase [Reyranella sp.]|uniref:fatty acyl-AMP ligase n=1 Tax=Reyranella sp. TaxID=1929291 RepID=UPI003D0E04CA
MTPIRLVSPARLPDRAASDLGTPPPSRFQRYDHALAHSADRRVDTPTPSLNGDLVFRRGGFTSLCDALDYAAHGETGLNFFDARGKLSSSLPYRDLQVQAQAFARRLIGAGFEGGERLVLIADTWPGFCIAFFGAQYAGVVPVPVSMPVGLGSRAGFIEQLRSQITVAGAVGVVAPDELAEFAQRAAEGTAVRLAGPMAAFNALPESRALLRPFGAGDACYIQFSSGSTREPRGIDIRQDQLMANITGSLAAQEVSATDSGVSWLPLYHDMGLIGFVLAPMCAQRSVDLLAPWDFARRPLQWLSLISRRRATITYGPSFGYDLAARRAQTKALGEIDLSCLRLAGVGADMIQPSVLQRFAESFNAAGFDPRAFLPSYGMAEVCVGVSFVRPFTGLRLDRPTDSHAGDSREFVVCGRVLSGHRIEIRDPDGIVFGEGRVGRLFVSGPSVMPGYFPPVEDSTDVLCNGWLDTGDLGYWRNDEIVITGRAKDLIIVNGRNIWPQDIEWSVEALPSLRRGDACAFSVDDGAMESVVIVVQAPPADAAADETLEGDIRQKTKEAFGVDGRVVLISRRLGLPLTSSGKLSRSATKATFLAGGYAGQ